MNKEIILETIKSLKKNQFDAYYAESKEEALDIAKKFLKKGDKISKGGSLTVKEIGLEEYIENGDFNTTAPEDKKEAIAFRFTSDVFLCSANAITQGGKLYNVDGICSRIAPLVYGPEAVIVIAGSNKIVKDIKAADERVRAIAAPLNAKKRGVDTPCIKDNICHDCDSTQRICCSRIITEYNRIPNRIKVIIVNEKLGM